MALLDRLVRPNDGGMQSFNYEAVSRSGERVRSKMIAGSEVAVRDALLREGWLPITIGTDATGMNYDVAQLFNNRDVKLSVRQTAEFARQLYQLLDAGVSVNQAFTTLGEDADDKVREMCDDIAAKITAGSPVSEALADHPGAFGVVFRAYVRAGEKAGTLEATMGRLATILTKRADMHNKIKSVTAYPKAISVIIFLVVTGILWFMVPMYADIYASFDAELPRPTQIVVTISQRMPYVLAALALLVMLGVFLLRRYGDEPKWAIPIDRFMFHQMPLFAKLNHRSMLFRWSSTMSGALGAGVPTIEALDLSGEAADSRWMTLLTPELMQAVREGRRMTSEMRETPEIFIPSLRTMMAVGEDTGTIDEMLESVSRSMDSDIDRIVATLGAKIEVALLAILGVVVGGLLAVLYLPILNLALTVMEGLGG